MLLVVEIQLKFNFTADLSTDYFLHNFNGLNVWAINCKKVEENVHHNVLKLKVKFLNHLLCLN